MALCALECRQTFDHQNRRRRRKVEAYEEASQRAVLECDSEARGLIKQMKKRQKKLVKELETYFRDKQLLVERLTEKLSQHKYLAPPSTRQHGNLPLPHPRQKLDFLEQTHVSEEEEEADRQKICSKTSSMQAHICIYTCM